MNCDLQHTTLRSSVSIQFSNWHPPLIFSLWMIHNPLLTQLVLVRPVYFVFSLIMRIAHVWHSLSANIHAPHLVQRITGSWVSVDSARFFVPTAWHLRHWKTLNPSWESYSSSQINSELAEQKLHLNLTKFSCPTIALKYRWHSCIDTPQRLITYLTIRDFMIHW